VQGPAATVELRGVAFHPADVTVKVGQSVTWVWKDDPIPHDVAFEGFKSSLQTKGQYAHTFDAAGKYAYRCDVHPSMIGSVVVAP